ASRASPNQVWMGELNAWPEAFSTSRPAAISIERSAPQLGSSSMRRSIRAALWTITALATIAGTLAHPDDKYLSLTWAHNMLTDRGEHLPGGAVKIWYIEAYCRPGSTDRDWNQTVIPHKTKLIAASADGRRLTLRSTLADGVIVDHHIQARSDEVDFRLTA